MSTHFQQSKGDDQSALRGFWLYATVLALFFNGYGYAASFDCMKAKGNVEQMICNNQTLSELDGEAGGLRYSFERGS